MKTPQPLPVTGGRFIRRKDGSLEKAVKAPPKKAATARRRPELASTDSVKTGD